MGKESENNIKQSFRTAIACSTERRVITREMMDALQHLRLGIRHKSNVELFDKIVKELNDEYNDAHKNHEIVAYYSNR